MLHCHSMAETIMSYLDIHLHLPPGTLEALHQHHVPAPEQLRFTKSPPQPHIDVPIKGHADLGSVTILFNQLGGLQILTPPYLTNGTEPEWLYVKPLPGHCIVNLGDALVKFSNGLLRSNMHRVVPPPGEQAELTRYSLVYFSRPDDNCVWKPLESDIIPKVKHREYDDVAESGASSTQLLLKKKEEVERMQKVSRHVIDSGQTGKHLKD
jgi:isopenicillin N synthase-like dioxygenase